MRIARLSLHAFGPFTGVELDFGNRNGLHVVYGPNEAGKSSTLRALTGLLYGIPVHTRDAHVHKMSDLLIGAELARNGHSIDVLRRKGSKNTLLSAADRTPLPDQVLNEVLGGVDQAIFTSTFGLDHESLRDGAQALLEGRGAVGESLFDAGVGGRGIQRVLAELREEADGLFRPRGQTQKVNQALRLLREARERRSHASVKPEAWTLQLEELDKARAEHASANERLRALRAEQNALQRMRGALPKLARRRELQARLDQLGKVVRLPEGAAAARIDVQVRLEECQRDRDRLRRAIATRRQQLDELAIREDVASLDGDYLGAIANRVGGFRQRLVDLPKLEAESEALVREVGRMAASLGRAAEDAAAAGDLLAHNRVRRLATEWSRLEDAIADKRRRLDDLTAERDERVAALRDLSEEAGNIADFDGFRAVLGDARAAADSADRLASLQDEIADADARLKRGCKSLRPAVKPSVLSAMALPARATVESFCREHDELALQERDLDSRQQSLAARQRENRRELRALERGGAVADEEALAASREQRDALWREIKSAGKAPAKARAAKLDRAMAAADDVADRLRREADRVAMLAALQAARSALEEESEELQAQRDACAARRSRHESAWKKVWKTAGIAAAEPPTMREWLEQVLALRELAERRDRAALEQGNLAERLDRRGAALAEQLRAAGQRVGRRESLATTIERARRVEEQFLEQARRRETLDHALVSLEGSMERERHGLEVELSEQKAWQKQWGAALAALGLPKKLPVGEALPTLDALVELDGTRGELERKRAQLDAAKAEQERFCADVAGLVAAHAPELTELAAADAVAKLDKLHRAAMTDVGTRSRLGRECDELASELEDAGERDQALAATLDRYMRDAGVDDIDALIAAEKASEDARHLDQALADCEEDLLEIGEGMAIVELEEQARGADIDWVRARLGELEGILDALDNDVQDLAADVRGKEEGLDRLQEADGAAAAADDEQACLAELRAHAERFIQVHLAGELLASEIERYRQLHQGPILSRANQLFPELTGGNYRELKVGYAADDEAVLRCVRVDGSEAAVGELSDGTRDQLYLALRLATLARFAENDEPLPLVLDDVLIHFDDDRARAALAVLGTVAESTQILFFTHHARLVELAREAVPSGRLYEHDLVAACAVET